MNDLALQTPEIAWSEATAIGALEASDWVGTTPETPYSQRRGTDGTTRFFGADRRAALPSSVVEAMDEVRGQATAWDGLTLLLARAEWLVAARGLLWTPSSAVPALLARLLDAAGLDPGLHRGDPDRLRRLAALLPQQRARRGTLRSAVELLHAAGERDQAAAPIVSTPSEDESTAPTATAHEVFVARDAAFWARRLDGEPVLRITDGLLRFQPQVGAAVSVAREDLLIRVSPQSPPPRDLYRLMPVWTVPRPVALPSDKE